MECGNENRLLLQFHITGRCNLRCKHCYRTEGNVQPLSLETVLDILDQFAALSREYNLRHRIKRRGHVNLTGGEPFFREDMDKILERLGAYRQELSFGILSNGSLIDDRWIRLLKENDVSFVQLSLDGTRKTHDALRAPGDYDRTLAMARRLEKNGIRTYISFTANRENYRQLPQVAAECRRAGITKLWTDRLVPIGNGEELRELAITAELLPDYLRVLRKAQGNWLTKLLWPRTQVTANRALQFQGAKGSFYTCSAGRSLITVDEFGQIMPCRRMPIICGKLPEEKLADVYYNHSVFCQLRQQGIPKACAQCRYALLCRGGARCQSYACTGHFTGADPGCPLTKRPS